MQATIECRFTLNLRCGVYWSAVLRRGKRLFKRNYSHEMSKLCNFLFPNKYVKYSITTSYFHFFVVCMLVYVHFNLVTVKLWSVF